MCDRSPLPSDVWPRVPVRPRVQVRPQTVEEAEESPPPLAAPEQRTVPAWWLGVLVVAWIVTEVLR